MEERHKKVTYLRHVKCVNRDSLWVRAIGYIRLQFQSTLESKIREFQYKILDWHCLYKRETQSHWSG